VEKLTDHVSALAAVNIYRLGYLLIFLGRITTPTAFGLSISLCAVVLSAKLWVSNHYSPAYETSHGSIISSPADHE
jgi:hypothetical protein